MAIRVLRLGEKVLTVLDRPVEDAAFKYHYTYLPEETVFNKPQEAHSMKIYTKIVIDMGTGNVVEEQSFDYYGPVAMAKGGGGGDSVDEAYNAGMLELSQEQQDWAREMYNQYKYGVAYDPNEMVADPDAQQISNPEWEAWNRNVTYDSEGGGSPQRVGPEPERYIDDPATMVSRGSQEGYDPTAQTSEMQYQQNVIEANQALLPQRTEVSSAFLDKALSGVDIGRRMDESQADVEHGFKLAGESSRREAMSYGGLDPSSIASISSGINLEKAKAIAGARTTAKTLGEDEEFNRLRSAMTSM